MNSYERVLYRFQGKVKTATLRNPTEGAWTLSGIKVNGQGREVLTSRDQNLVVIHLTRSVIRRTPMRMNNQGTELEEM